MTSNTLTSLSLAVAFTFSAAWAEQVVVTSKEVRLQHSWVEIVSVVDKENAERAIEWCKSYLREQVNATHKIWSDDPKKVDEVERLEYICHLSRGVEWGRVHKDIWWNPNWSITQPGEREGNEESRLQKVCWNSFEGVDADERREYCYEYAQIG